MAEYYFIDSEGNQIGPIDEQQLRNYPLRSTTLVWREGMESWQALSRVPELRHLMPSPTPPPPRPVTPPPYSEPEPKVQVRPQRAEYDRQSMPDYESCPPTYLGWAIVVTLLCCIPFGVVAIIYASRVQGQWNMGDYAAARQSSQKAKTWTLVAFGSSLAVYLLYFALLIQV